MIWLDMTRERGVCQCGELTWHRCACSGWWCHKYLWRHTTGTDGRCSLASQGQA